MHLRPLGHLSWASRPPGMRGQLRSERRRRARSAAFLSRPRHARKLPWKGRGGQPPTDAGRADAPVFGAGGTGGTRRTGRTRRAAVPRGSRREGTGRTRTSGRVERCVRLEQAGRLERKVRQAVPAEAARDRRMCARTRRVFGEGRGRTAEATRTARTRGFERTARTQGASGGPRGSREGPYAVRADAPMRRERDSLAAAPAAASSAGPPCGSGRAAANFATRLRDGPTARPLHDAAQRSLGPSAGRDGSNPSQRTWTHREGMVRVVLKCSGERGIRTLGTLTDTPDFESGTFGHSVISPRRNMNGRAGAVNA